MFKKIVVPLDGSPLAETVLSYLEKFVSPEKTVIELVSVVEPWRYFYATEFSDTSLLINEMHKSSEAYLQQQNALLSKQGYTVSSHLLNGDPATEILSVAESTGADLIAMTTHGRSGIARLALGSVAERVLHSTKLPILLVREATHGMSDGIKRILAPLDGSIRSEQALPVTEMIAKETDAQVILLEVVQHLNRKNQEMIFRTQENAEEVYASWVDHAEGYLQDVEYRLAGNGIKVQYKIGSDDPVKTICDTAKNDACDLVVIGSHGRTGIARWFYGSVASKVMREVECPILLVHTYVEEKANTPEADSLLSELG